MCGAFGFTGIEKEYLEHRYGVTVESDIQTFRFSPHGTIPTISRNSPNQLVMRHWSIIPPYISDPRDLKYPTFNARSETLREKVTFKKAWENAQRCLIPATQFYEWKKQYDGKKIISRTPYTIKTDDQIFSFAGLYAPWNDIETCTIVTTEPNHDMKDIHNRMPVILSREEEELWLDKGTDLDVAYSLLRPYPDGELRITEGLPLEAQRRPVNSL